jgi:hypothetical protein
MTLVMDLPTSKSLRSAPYNNIYSDTVIILTLGDLKAGARGGGGVQCKKRLVVFPSPARMSLTEFSLAGNNFIIPAHKEFGDIPAGDGKTAILFLQCRVEISCEDIPHIVLYSPHKRHAKIPKELAQTTFGLSK